MNSFLTSVLIKTLQSIITELEKGNIKCSEQEKLEALEMLEKFNTARPLSKDLACEYMNLSRSTFDTYIRNGWIPKGKKVRGFKELSWRLIDLAIAKEKLNDMIQ